MTDGIIRDLFLPVLTVFYEQWQEDNQEDPESEYTKESNRRYHIVSKLHDDLIKNVKLEILSIYEQNPTFPVHTLKLVQKQLIGDNEE